MNWGEWPLTGEQRLASVLIKPQLNNRNDLDTLDNLKAMDVVDVNNIIKQFSEYDYTTSLGHLDQI